MDVPEIDHLQGRHIDHTDECAMCVQAKRIKQQHEWIDNAVAACARRKCGEKEKRIMDLEDALDVAELDAVRDFAEKLSDCDDVEERSCMIQAAKEGG